VLPLQSAFPKLKLERSLYEILQILSVAHFEKTPVLVTRQSENYQNKDVPMRNQLSLFSTYNRTAVN
jgi:hypothetical protein